jgi:NAD(P)-dependent dehydrogenase (short-subunit alcohol dehydrogenase family)
MPADQIAVRAARLLSLKGKVAIVTGAASGIGRGIALRLAEMGAFVAALDIDEKQGPATAKRIQAQGGKSIFLKCDVRSASDCREAVATIIGQRSPKKRGMKSKIDILCNCAGVIVRKDIVELPEDDWDRVLDVTLKSVYLLSREVVPHMIRGGGGSIVNVGSGWALTAGPRAAAYCAAKAGVLNLTRAMAIDHGKHNICVNCVCPGDVDTPMLRSECAQLGEDTKAFMREAANRPLARVGTPEDIANAVLFLTSPMSRWVTGAALVVDGGGLA